VILNVEIGRQYAVISGKFITSKATKEVEMANPTNLLYQGSMSDAIKWLNQRGTARSQKGI